MRKTEFLLLAQYGGRTVIPIEDVARDFFTHLGPPKLIRYINEGKIALPMIRMDASRNAAKCVHLSDLAEYLDERRAAAQKEARQLAGAMPVKSMPIFEHK